MAGKLTIGVLLVMLVALASSGNGRKRIPPWHIKMAQSQGPNACAVEEIPGTNRRFWTECRYWMHRRICGLKTVIRYECCEGYDRFPGQLGCTAVRPLKTILDTAAELGAVRFVQALVDAGLADRLQQSGTYTLFAPTDEAFETATIRQREQLARSRGNPQSSFLLYHLVEKRVHTRDLNADQVVNTMSPGGQIRLNKYSSGMFTANCNPIARKDLEATNGIVHLVDGFLEAGVPFTLTETLIREGKYTQLSRFIQEGLLTNELQLAGPHTIFAPTDEAFRKLPYNRMQKIRSDPDARKAVLQAHIIPHAICLAAITDAHKLRTLNGDRVNLSCNETGIYVENQKIDPNAGSVLSTNGIVYSVGNVVIPDRAKTLLEIAESTGQVDQFVELVRSAGLEEALEGPTIVTAFVPSDEALNELSSAELRRLTQNTAELREFLLRHIVSGRHPTERIRNDQKLDCLDGKTFLRARVYRKGYGIESAVLTTADLMGQNGVLHITDKVILPPLEDAVQVLRRDGNHSIMLEAIQKISRSDPDLLHYNWISAYGRSVARNRSTEDDYEDALIAQEPGLAPRRKKREWEGSLTLFVPSDDAFRELGREKLRQVMSDSAYLEQVVKNHIINAPVASGSIRNKLHYTIRTKQQSYVDVHRTKDHKLLVGGAQIVTPDLVTSEGIMHFVNKVLLPEEAKARPRGHVTMKAIMNGAKLEPQEEILQRSLVITSSSAVDSTHQETDKETEFLDRQGRKKNKKKKDKKERKRERERESRREREG